LRALTARRVLRLVGALNYRQRMIGDLRQTRNGGWVTEPPGQCPNGHALGGGQVLVGHIAHCTVLDGSAAVRISNRRRDAR